MRTLLTIFGMSIGIATIIFLVSFGYGLQSTLLEKITTADSLVTLDVTSEGETEPALDARALQMLKGIPGISSIVPAVSFSSQGKFNNITLDLETIGSQATFPKLNGQKLLAGRFADEANPSLDAILVSSAIANAFGKQPDEMIGQSFSLTIFPQNIPATPVKKSTPPATFSHTYAIIGIIDSEENTAFVSIDTIDTAAYATFSQIKVKCQSTSVMPIVAESIANLHLTTSSLSETIDQANKVFYIIQIILMFFGIVALLVSAIGMFNTMTIALLERTQEIGIMKSIGASPHDISSLFIIEATLMGFLGGAFGVIFGVFGSSFVNYLVNIIAQRFGGDALNLFFSPIWFIFATLIFGTFVGFLTGIFPAQKASQVDPLDALRYK
jgi:putative ABC transport system permease protein